MSAQPPLDPHVTTPPIASVAVPRAVVSIADGTLYRDLSTHVLPYRCGRSVRHLRAFRSSVH